VIDRICAAGRAESQAAAAQLVAMGSCSGIGSRGVRIPRSGRFDTMEAWRRRWARRCGSVRGYVVL